MTSVFDLPPGMARVKGVHLYPYQADGVAFLVSKKRALLGDDMGLGKTRQAIVAMESAAPNGPVLVVCPASLKLNWRREILLVDKDARIEVLGFDREAQPEPRWVIVNYDILRNRTAACRSLVGHHPRRGSFHQEQQPENLALLKLLGVGETTKSTILGPDFVFLLTGTPLTNRPRDIFNLLRCVGHPAARSFLINRFLAGWSQAHEEEILAEADAFLNKLD